MKGIRHYLCSGILILSGIFLTSCATISPNNAGKLGDVSIADANEVGRLSTGLTMADYLGFAENVTNKMLKSRFVQGWGDTKPKLMVGDLVNNTDNEYIRMQDLYDRVQETIFNTGLVRIIDKSATSFDYIVKTELTSTRQYGEDGEQLAYYTMQMKMFTLDGELKGQWSDDLALAKGKRRLF
jgi:hypothetical protein